VIPDSPWWLTLVIAVPTLVLGAGRITRAIYHDDFPPSIWFRVKWDLLTENSSWNLLFHCPWCLSFWVTGGLIGWFALGFLAPWIWWTWWIVVGWFALAYLVPMIIVRDEPDTEDE